MKMKAKIILSGLLVAAISVTGVSVFAGKSDKAEYKEYLKQYTEEKLTLAYDNATSALGFDDSDYQLFTADSSEKPEDMTEDDYILLRMTMGQTIFDTNEIEQGDFAPAIYVKNSLDEAVVLVQKKNGESKMFVYEKDDSEEFKWKLVDKKEAKGDEVEIPEQKSFERFVQEKASN
ncbi:hypothetical protein E8L90_24165 [Brevibacillus antibioticus]|uniref:DUF5590 domain-containing protein n=1 Tax=Brevibacillus antibioticus TaxID=2570228 RepID=A0A4U2YBS1_9BACL|nr:hypothetical protein [Brevibacillus antibioticus]TKI58236.1 hypothetical protein E8L90_24165 [Brevibacillus antibioticus]